MKRPRQFTLRTFLAITIAIGVLTGIYANRVAHQRSDVAALAEVGGSVEYSCAFCEVDQIPAWLNSSLGPDFFCDIARVNMAGMSIIVADPPVVFKDGETTVTTCSTAVQLPLQSISSPMRFGMLKPTQSCRLRWGATLGSGVHVQYDVYCMKAKDGMSHLEFRVRETATAPTGFVDCSECSIQL